MILVDANLLLYAEDSSSEHHAVARAWWDAQLSGVEPVALCWPVLNAFIRIGTNARLHQQPLLLGEAIDRVQSWLEQPCVRLIHPGDQHWALFQQLLRGGKAVGNLVSDASRGAGRRAQLRPPVDGRGLLAFPRPEVAKSDRGLRPAARGLRGAP